jgi:hypothetical protein
VCVRGHGVQIPQRRPSLVSNGPLSYEGGLTYYVSGGPDRTTKTTAMADMHCVGRGVQPDASQLPLWHKMLPKDAKAAHLGHLGVGSRLVFCGRSHCASPTLHLRSGGECLCVWIANEFM